jgi:hypothetical protein
VPRSSPSSLGRNGRLSAFYARWLPWVFGLTAAANLVLLAFLPLSGWPIRAHDDASLTHLVRTEQPSVDRRFGFYLELDDATDGGVLIVPSGSFVEPELASGFADFQVSEVDYDPSFDLPDDVVDPDPIGMVETDEGDVPYSIVTGEDDVWWIAFDDGGIVVVPESVAPVPWTAP